MKSEKTVKIMLAHLSGLALRAAEEDDDETGRLLMDIGETLAWVLSDSCPEPIQSSSDSDIQDMLCEYERSLFRNNN